ncbi:MAG: hypothetical protein LWX11_01245, partial [Firmicutes bacterium]|nr:hypothetical protein [Bacillota bacterium]
MRFRPILLSRLIALWSAIVAVSLFAAPTGPAGLPDCYSCHEKTVHAQEYAKSSHRDLSCTACHQVVSLNPAAKTAPGERKVCIATYGKMDCARCHKPEAQEHATSVHNGQRLPVSCAKCHAGIHRFQSAKGDKLVAARMCSTCHTRQHDYFDSIHFQNLKKGNLDSPTCIDCHGRHN